jgi:hypothetical protein
MQTPEIRSADRTQFRCACATCGFDFETSFNIDVQQLDFATSGRLRAHGEGRPLLIAALSLSPERSESTFAPRPL